jgi:hypothetical protein
MWFIFALITSFLYAAYYICNQESKLKPEIFIIYRGLLAALIATPLVIFYHHTFPWQFYAIVLFQGITISYMDYKYFQAFHKFGAEIVNSIKPLTVMITFILWLIITPSMLNTYLAAPYRSAIIVISLTAIIYAVMNYQHQKIGRQSLKFVTPLLFLSSLVDISNKLIMQYAEGHLLTLTFHRVALTGWIIGIINLLLNQNQPIKLKELCKLKNICRGSFILLLLLSMISINFAMHYAPNPAYTSAVIYLSIIWIVLINKFIPYTHRKKHYPPIALKWMLLLLFAAITLVLATRA